MGSSKSRTVQAYPKRESATTVEASESTTYCESKSRAGLVRLRHTRQRVKLVYPIWCGSYT